MLQFEILRAQRRGHGKLSTLDLKEQTLASSGTCLVESHQIKPWRKISPIKAIDIPGSPPLSSGAMHPNEEEGRHQEACVGAQEAPGQTEDTKKKSTESGSRNRKSGRNTKRLSKQTGIQPGNLKP